MWEHEKNHDRQFFFKYKNLYCRHISGTLSTFCIACTCWMKKKLLEKMSGRLNNFFKNYVHNFSIIANSSEAFHTHQQFSFSRRTKIQISDANFFAAVAAMMMFIIKVFSPFVCHKLKLMWYGLGCDYGNVFFKLTFSPTTDLFLFHKHPKKSH